MCSLENLWARREEVRLHNRIKVECSEGWTDEGKSGGGKQGEVKRRVHGQLADEG